MKIQTFSIIAGSEACNARCPFCISKMTPPQGVTLKEPEVNWRNFGKACLLAKQSNVTTAMITGKGEPTIFPTQITKYLDALKIAEEIGPEKLYKKYKPIQKQIISKLNEDFNLGIKESDVFLLGYLPKKDSKKLTEEQLNAISEFEREDNYRFCLTPYFEIREKKTGRMS